MAVTFTVKGGAEVTVLDNNQLMETASGKIKADTLQIGDCVRIATNLPRVAITSIPVVS